MVTRYSLDIPSASLGRPVFASLVWTGLAGERVLVSY